MANLLLTILKTGTVSQRGFCPDLPQEAMGLPMITGKTCQGEECGRCVDACPTKAISIQEQTIVLDRGWCIGCGSCLGECPTGTIAQDRSTAIAVRTRPELIQSNRPLPRDESAVPVRTGLFARSLHVREVSTGDSATDLEVIAATNSIFDVARYGIHFVASPRYADALLVSGPVGRAMHEPLRRCYGAMAEPRLVIAVGTSAISGGLFFGGYAEGNGVGNVLPVDCFIPGDPPHPWAIIHGLLSAMGRV